MSNLRNANLNQTIIYTITITNHGLDTANGVYAHDYLSTFIRCLSSSTSVGSYNPITGLWYIGDLSPGKSVILTINTLATKPGYIVNMVEVTTTNQFGSIIATSLPINVNENSIPEPPKVPQPSEPTPLPEPPKNIKHDNKTNITGEYVNIDCVNMEKTGISGIELIILLLSIFILAVKRKK